MSSNHHIQHQHNQHNERQEQYDVLSEKIKHLRIDLASHSDAATCFLLGKQIEQAEKDRDKLKKEIETLEEQLGRVPQPEVRGPKVAPVAPRRPKESTPKPRSRWRKIIGAVAVAIVIISLIVAVTSLGFGWWVSPPPAPPTQTLDTFCKYMKAGNNDLAETQFTSQGWLQFQPQGQHRNSYSSCTYDSVTILTDTTAQAHLAVKSSGDNQLYGITVTLILDGRTTLSGGRRRTAGVFDSSLLR